jgi:poly-gamma-glutamate capsule biosynthesis protein CapA/YwtB (metallophosphatase superfamily)
VTRAAATAHAARLFLPLLLTLALADGEPRADEASVGPSRSPLGAADGELTLFLAGDAIITQPWSGDRDPGFLALVDTIRAADVALVNLELVLHEFKGYAQADDSGGYMAARSGIAAELAWAGVDLVAHANNHTFDYGSIGVLETLDSAARAGLGLAGSGKDLQAARAPAYFPHPDGTVALVATASSFIPYGKASRSRPDLHGRPGLNPLASEADRYLEVPPFAARALWGAAELAGVPRRRLDEAWFELLGLRFHAGERPGWRKWRRLDPKDLEGNLAAVRAAAAAADLVVFSIHAHQRGPREGPWLTELAHRAIDAGADVFFAHGPHRMLGIELYKGRPIFYGPGDFVFQPHRLERVPVEIYDRAGLGDDATVEDAREATVEGNPFFLAREPWEAFAPVLRFDGGQVREVRLLPLDLGFDRPLPVRGKPRLADAALGRRIVDQVAELSRPYGTVVRYLKDENAGWVDLGRGLAPAPAAPSPR